MTYGDHLFGATWCECGELLDHKHYYEEAYKKINEYHALNNRFINKGDWELILKIEMGYVTVKPSKKNFENTQDMGCNTDKFVEMANEIIEQYAKFHKIPVDYDDFDKANVKQTVKLLDFIYDSFLEPGAERSTNLDDYEFLEPIRFGIRHLAVKGEKKKAKAFYEKVISAGVGDYKREVEKTKDWMMNEEED